MVKADQVIKSLRGHDLSERHEKILRYLVINEQIDNDQCQKLCGSIRRTASRDLSALVKKGLLEMKGQLKAARYTLSKKIIGHYRTSI